MTEYHSTAALWWAVAASGVYHGANPGMGWPLAVSVALFERRRTALLSAFAALGAGHFLAMLAILAPFSMMTAFVNWEQLIRVGAGMLVLALGVVLFFNRKHPRFLARIPPHRLVLWSLLVALAHGAALMLVPIYLGLCTAPASDAGHQAAAALMGTNVLQALAVAGAHTMAMVAAGSLIAAAVYFWLGLRFLSKSWFNLDVVWALSLITVGTIGIVQAI